MLRRNNVVRAGVTESYGGNSVVKRNEEQLTALGSSKSESLDSTALRIRVAELRGWKRVGRSNPSHDCYYAKGLRSVPAEYLPNYPGDLNAIAEAEKVLDSLPTDTRSLWLDLLALQLTWPDVANAADLRFELQYLTARATAEQRCRAFVATMEGRSVSDVTKRYEGSRVHSLNLNLWRKKKRDN